ncbi:hypothetical protein LZ31DRAFT_16554 [Colletotrichum somersetense]|nr:hypothetical protein LZ31DRAFT_16554 [Colletotrichum somersetense]
MIVTVPATVAQDESRYTNGNAVVDAVDDEQCSVCVQDVTEAGGAVGSGVKRRGRRRRRRNGSGKRLGMEGGEVVSCGREQFKVETAQLPLSSSVLGAGQLRGKQAAPVQNPSEDAVKRNPSGPPEKNERCNQLREVNDWWWVLAAMIKDQGSVGRGSCCKADDGSSVRSAYGDIW